MKYYRLCLDFTRRTVTLSRLLFAVLLYVWRHFMEIRHIIV